MKTCKWSEKGGITYQCLSLQNFTQLHADNCMNFSVLSWGCFDLEWGCLLIRELRTVSVASQR